MDENFKYPIVPMFFDADKIACTCPDDIIIMYPEYEVLKDKFEDKSWTIERYLPSPKDYVVMAVADAQDIITEYEEAKLNEA